MQNLLMTTYIIRRRLHFLNIKINPSCLKLVPSEEHLRAVFIGDLQSKPRQYQNWKWLTASSLLHANKLCCMISNRAPLMISKTFPRRFLIKHSVNTHGDNLSLFSSWIEQFGSNILDKNWIATILKQ